MRKTVIIGNWKMNKSPEEAKSFSLALNEKLNSIPENTLVGITPTHLAFTGAREALKGSDILVGAQNGYHEKSGAFTGQVSFDMLKNSGADFSLVGHSEQRELFGETDKSVRIRTEACLSLGLLPVVCVGEKLEERESGQMEAVLERQISEGLKGLSLNSGSELILAYEPVWAIGTGKTATPEMAQEAHAFCRKILSSTLGEDLASTISIQYGGSAKPSNSKELLAQKDIDGLLVGGASLEVESFAAMIQG